MTSFVTAQDCIASLGSEAAFVFCVGGFVLFFLGYFCGWEARS